MVEKFHEELEELKRDVIKMGELAVYMLEKSIESLKKQDIELADNIINKKTEIANFDEKIEENALRLMALYQPMAIDLRTIACILKIITYLTRIGRYAKDIANVTKDLSEKPHIGKLVSMPYMTTIVTGMINDSLKAFETGDLNFLKNFYDRDENVDSMRFFTFRECVTYMMEDPKTITQCSHYIMISRYLERCGDHACKIAEKVHYMITGERIDIG